MKMLWLILFSGSCMAQTMVITSVTGQVKDASGNIYANCQWSAVFVGQNTNPGIVYAPQAVLNGQQGTCDSSGNLTVSLADNIQTITPTPSQWSFSICSASGYVGGPYCKSNILITITGNSQNITSTLTPVMPLLPQLGLNLSAPPAIGNITPNIGDFCGFNLTEYVGGLCASFWGGGDIGAQINSAYAALPSTGGIINVLGGFTTYNFSTPIVLGTASKPVLVDLGGNTLNYTPITATTAITLSYSAPGTNGGFQPHGIRNGLLQNNGCPAGNSCGGYTSSSSATGIIIGSASNSATGPQVYSVVISGFATGVYLPGINNVMWGAVLFNDMISSNTTGILCDTGGAYESLQIIATRITINQTGLNQKCNFDIYMHGASMDGNTIAIQQSGSHTFIDGTHFEDTNASSGLIAQVTGGAVVFSNSFFLDDNSTGTIASWFTCATSGQLDFSQVDISSAGRTTTASVINVGTGCNLVGTGSITNDTPAVLTSLVQGASTNQIYTVNSGGTNSITANLLNSPVFQAVGAVPTLTGTGACATSSTQVGGMSAGSFVCTGTTGASTVTLTFGTAAKHWYSCFASDTTHTLTGSQSGTASTTACTMTFTSVTANDIITFGAIAF